MRIDKKVFLNLKPRTLYFLRGIQLLNSAEISQLVFNHWVIKFGPEFGSAYSYRGGKLEEW